MEAVEEDAYTKRMAERLESKAILYKKFSYKIIQ